MGRSSTFSQEGAREYLRLLEMQAQVLVQYFERLSKSDPIVPRSSPLFRTVAELNSFVYGKCLLSVFSLQRKAAQLIFQAQQALLPLKTLLL